MKRCSRTDLASVQKIRPYPITMQMFYNDNPVNDNEVSEEKIVLKEK